MAKLKTYVVHYMMDNELLSALVTAEGFIGAPDGGVAFFVSDKEKDMREMPVVFKNPLRWYDDSVEINPGEYHCPLAVSRRDED